MTRVILPLEAGHVTFDLPEAWSVRRAAVTPPPSLPPLVDAARDALAHPLGGERLRDLARPGMRVTVAVPDATRPSPDAVLLPLLLHELAAAGVRETDVTVLVALGMHRHTTPEERRRMLGDAGERLTVVDAQGAERARYRPRGAVADPALPVPVPVHLHERVLDADLLVATGVVEPHQYAGFSGGRKTVALGCAGEETIRVLHGVPFLEAPGTRIGGLEGNPLHAALERIAREAGLRFVLNVAFSPEGALLGVAAGSPAPVLEALVARLLPVTWARVGRVPYDVILAGVPPAKSSNLYQVSRALTYAAFSPRPALRDGGIMVLPARCPEGAGEGPGEREFLASFRDGERPEDTVSRLRAGGFGAGGQRAFMVARALTRHRALIVGAAKPEEMRRCGFRAAATPAEAMAFLRDDLGAAARVLVIPQALALVPVAEDP